MSISDDLKGTVQILRRTVDRLEEEQSNLQETIRQLQNGIAEREKQNIQLQKQIEGNHTWNNSAWGQIKKAQERIKAIDTDLREIADHLDKIVP